MIIKVQLMKKILRNGILNMSVALNCESNFEKHNLHNKFCTIEIKLFFFYIKIMYFNVSTIDTFHFQKCTPCIVLTVPSLGVSNTNYNIE